MDSIKQSDEAIAKQVQAGDVDSFVELIKRYQPRLTRYSIYLSQDYDLAEDATQETFIKVYANLQSFNTKKKFSSWIYRIAHNETMNLLKKRKPLSIDDQPNLENYIEKSDIESLEELVDKKITKETVKNCLQILSVKYREPIVLYYIQGNSYADISYVLRMPVSTVGIRIKRGKAKLKEICRTLGVQHA